MYIPEKVLKYIDFFKILDNFIVSSYTDDVNHNTS